MPKWRLIAEDLRKEIELGELGGDGAALPTELDLQNQYGASRATVRDAIKVLAARGLVYTRSGQGTFVVHKVDPFVTHITGEPEPGMEESSAFAVSVMNRRRAPEVSLPRVEIRRPVGLAARELRLTEGSSVICRHQRRFIDGVPYSLQTTFYPMALAERGASRLILAENIPEGAVNYIEAVLGIREAGRRDLFTVRVPDSGETEFFGLPEDGRIVLLELIRTGFDESGQPFRVTVTTFPADRNELLIRTGVVPDEQ
jgi:GntR family transcriptional regulator